MTEAEFYMKVAANKLPLSYSALKSATNNNFRHYYISKPEKAEEVELATIVAYLLFQPEKLQEGIIRIPADVGNQKNVDKELRKQLTAQALAEKKLLVDEKEEKDALMVIAAFTKNPQVAGLLQQCTGYDFHEDVDYKYGGYTFKISRYMPAFCDSHIVSISIGSSDPSDFAQVVRKQKLYMQAYINSLLTGDLPIYRIICDKKGNVTPFYFGEQQMELGRAMLETALDRYIENMKETKKGNNTIWNNGYAERFIGGIVPA